MVTHVALSLNKKYSSHLGSRSLMWRELRLIRNASSLISKAVGFLRRVFNLVLKACNLIWKVTWKRYITGYPKKPSLSSFRKHCHSFQLLHVSPCKKRAVEALEVEYIWELRLCEFEENFVGRHAWGLVIRVRKFELCSSTRWGSSLRHGFYKESAPHPASTCGIAHRPPLSSRMKRHRLNIKQIGTSPERRRFWYWN